MYFHLLTFTYSECTTANHVHLWCSTNVDENGTFIHNQWGNCDISVGSCPPGKAEYIVAFSDTFGTMMSDNTCVVATTADIHTFGFLLLTQSQNLVQGRRSSKPKKLQ